MTVLRIRSHKRFGVCHKVQLSSSDHRSSGGLLIEVSLEGFRISNVDSSAIAVDDLVRVDIDGETSLKGQIRWLHDNIAGLRLQPPLHASELDRLIRICRGEAGEPQARRA